MLEAHVATSASTDTQEIPSTCISMPSDPVLMKGFIFISNNAVLSWFLWQVYAHSHNVVNNWHSLTVTCYQATVVEHIFTKKIWHPFPHSIKHNLFVLGASCTTVLNILLCPHQERVTCLWSLVDNAQNWFLIHYVSCRWVAQLSTNNNMFQPCTPIKASMALKTLCKWSWSVIPFWMYNIYFFFFFKQSFNDLQIKIGICLPLKDCYSLAPFSLWQD